MKRVANIVLFNALWVILVLGAAGGFEWAGLIFLAGWLPLHLYWSDHPVQDIRVALAAVILCPWLDATLMHLDLIQFQGWAPVSGFVPLWIIALWAGFALTLNGSMSFLRQRVLLATVFGAVGAPFSYWAGARFGAATLAEPNYLSLLGIGLGWGIVLPLLACTGPGRTRQAEAAPA